MPPIILAALRKRMVALAGEIAEGVVFANASLSHMGQSLAALPAARRNDPNFFIGNRIRTCICDESRPAKAVLRRTVTNYALMPNYRNYWKEAGYVEEMNAIETAVAEGRIEEIPNTCRTGGWPTPLSAPRRRFATGSEAWRAAGITTPVLVPLSADGNQRTTLRQVFDAFK